MFYLLKALKDVPVGGFFCVEIVIFAALALSRRRKYGIIKSHKWELPSTGKARKRELYEKNSYCYRICNQYRKANSGNIL